MRIMTHEANRVSELASVPYIEKREGKTWKINLYLHTWLTECRNTRYKALVVLGIFDSYEEAMLVEANVWERICTLFYKTCYILWRWTAFLWDDRRLCLVVGAS